MVKLLTHNPKTAKSVKLGILTAVVHLAPHKPSGRNVCAAATPGCIAGCLNTAGFGGIALDADGLNDVQRARIARTQWFTRDRHAFMDRLARELELHERRADREGLTPAVRLNGTSDLPYERIPVNGHPHIFAMFETTRFYDYTKHPLRVRTRALDIPNYNLTFSLAETAASERHATEYLTAGVNVAVVFRANARPKPAAPLPDTFMDRPVIDGDQHDVRYLDPPGVIVGLRSKGRAYHDTTGFVRDY